MGAEELLQWNDTGSVSHEKRGIFDLNGVLLAIPKEAAKNEKTPTILSILENMFCIGRKTKYNYSDTQETASQFRK